MIRQTPMQINKVNNATKLIVILPPLIDISGTEKYLKVKNILSALRALSKGLKMERIKLVTDEDENNRPLMVMARGFHPTYQNDDIV